MPKIRVTCPSCSATYSVEEMLIGKRGRCARCKCVLVITRWSAGQVFLDEFVIERLLGAGGMGAVYLVRSRFTGQRFAVKTILASRFAESSSRRAFLDELQIWIDLPKHPHLAACRFFRTVGDEIAIFAEYVAGGSLAKWIRGGKLVRLADLLDVAIQFAWGLHAAHEAGFIHQDVKPANVLMTPDGIAKVADFGLARAGACGGEGVSQASARHSILVSNGGMTPAYCSPEQAEGRPLSPKTDMWSWGVSVLEMFTGEVTWPTGQVAAEALGAYLEEVPADNRLPRMPAGVADVLRCCLQREPAKRWATLAEASNALERVYRVAAGREYSRTATLLLIDDHPAEAHDRRTTSGFGSWTDPKEWLHEAVREAGRDPAEVQALLPTRQGSRKAQAIADLAAYEEARRMFARLIAGNRKELEPRLAALCEVQAFVHENAGDGSGALGVLDQAILIYERLVNAEGRRDLAGFLVGNYTNKALLLAQRGEHRAALALYDQAIPICEQLVSTEGRQALASTLAIIYHNKAGTVAALGEVWAAVALYDQAIAIRERLVKADGQQELANSLANSYQNKANALVTLGELRAAVALYDQAIAIREQLVKTGGRHDLAQHLACTYHNKARVANDLGDQRAAAILCDKAIAIFQHLVNTEGRHALANDLASAYQNKAIFVSDRGDERAAVALCDHAIAIHERLVNVEGRRELASNLASNYQNKATYLRGLGEYPAAIALYDRAIAIHERLVSAEGRGDLATSLANTYQNKGQAVAASGDKRAAVGLYGKAIAIYERLVHQEKRFELQGELGRILAFRADTLLNLGDPRRAAADAHAAIEGLRSAIARTGRADWQRTLDWAVQALHKLL